AADSSIDGIDQNCDGIDGPDLDGDGYIDAAAGGDDCNDDPNDADGDGVADGYTINPGEIDDSADGTDQDCDGLDGPYVADFMVDDLIEGDLILTEFLADPVAVSDGDGEWIEFQVNPTLTGSLDLQGLSVSDLGTNSFVISDSLIVYPGEYVLLTKNGDSASNGGITGHYEYGSAMSLSQSGDSVVLSNSILSIDSVIWNSTFGFTISAGASTSLEPGYIDFTLNDDGANWCDGSTAYGAGDFGTPGLPNDSCGYAVIDQDGDGYTNDIDCNDNPNDPNAPLTNPGAPDDSVDGLDQDCDGFDGPDNDGDGFADSNAGGDDCNDDPNDPNAPLINPDAIDNTIDGIDQNCDGSDAIDNDGDGYVDSNAGGDDCNDDPNDPNAPLTNPGAADDSVDGLDQDCDGFDGPDNDGDGF
ncbi:MAG: lamin tail domain-containing protein, partial [Myxococcota bacterium]|nr:lamin tail domain-containing protein [Myxococcota bacterium]